jgi:hypothetical protein
MQEYSPGRQKKIRRSDLERTWQEIKIADSSADLHQKGRDGQACGEAQPKKLGNLGG